MFWDIVLVLYFIVVIVWFGESGTREMMERNGYEPKNIIVGNTVYSKKDNRD